MNVTASFTKDMVTKHIKFTASPTELFLNHNYPHLSASPDGLVSCECGQGFSRSNALLSLKTFHHMKLLIVHSICSIILKKTCIYVLRMTTTIKSRGKWEFVSYHYCDFVCWTTKGFVVHRIQFDSDFFHKCAEELQSFFIKYINPELLTRKVQSSLQKDDSLMELDEMDVNLDDEELELFCFCRQSEFGQMVACDNFDCEFGWFHFECVGLTEEPEGDWYCGNCKDKFHLSETGN